MFSKGMLLLLIHQAVVNLIPTFIFIFIFILSSRCLYSHYPRHNFSHYCSESGKKKAFEAFGTIYAIISIGLLGFIV